MKTAAVALLLLLGILPGVSNAGEEARDAPSAPKAGAAQPEPHYTPPAQPATPASQTKATPDILYVPPEVGFPGHRVGAGTRGMGRGASLQLLAPDHLGYTTEAQPTLYWYLRSEERR